MNMKFVGLFAVTLLMPGCATAPLITNDVAFTAPVASDRAFDAVVATGTDPGFMTLLASAALASEPASSGNDAQYRPCPTRWWVSASATDVKTALIALHAHLEKVSSSVERIDRGNLYTLKEPRGLITALQLQYGAGGLMVMPRLSKQCKVWDGGYAHRLDPLPNSDQATVRAEMKQLVELWKSDSSLSAVAFQLRSQ